MHPASFGVLSEDLAGRGRGTASTGLWSPSVRVNDDAAAAIQDSPSIAVSSTGEAVSSGPTAGAAGVA